MSRRPKTGVTIVDIARELGVSAMTVSRALNGSREVSEETRRKVSRCAERLGYRPHRWARSLVTNVSSVIGVVVPDISHSYFAEVTRGVEEVAAKAGYDLLLSDSWMDVGRERHAIDTLVGSRVAGLIVASEEPAARPQPFVKLHATGTPFVLVDRFFPGRPFAAVHVDDAAVGRLAAECLLDLGHRRVAHIRGPHISPARLRHRGYLEALRARGIEAREDYVAAGRFDIESGREAMRKLLALSPHPTGVFAGNDPMAIGAFYACREAGLAVPADISIVGAGNIEGAHHPNPFLSTVDWPRVDLGRMAAQMLIAAIADPGYAARTEILAPRLLARQSTAGLQSGVKR